MFCAIPKGLNVISHRVKPMDLRTTKLPKPRQGLNIIIEVFLQHIIEPILGSGRLASIHSPCIAYMANQIQLLRSYDIFYNLLKIIDIKDINN